MALVDHGHQLQLPILFISVNVSLSLHHSYPSHNRTHRAMSFLSVVSHNGHHDTESFDYFFLALNIVNKIGFL